MTDPAMLTRRHFLSLLAALPAAPAAAALPPPAEGIVIVEGWVLRTSDLAKAAAHAP
jgi:hypothetical protein